MRNVSGVFTLERQEDKHKFNSGKYSWLHQFICGSIGPKNFREKIMLAMTQFFFWEKCCLLMLSLRLIALN